MVQLCRGLQTNTHLEEFGLGLRACTSQMKEVINATLAINLTLKRLLVMPEDFPDDCFAPRGADHDELYDHRSKDEYDLERLLDRMYRELYQAREAGLAVRTRGRGRGRGSGSGSGRGRGRATGKSLGVGMKEDGDPYPTLLGVGVAVGVAVAVGVGVGVGVGLRVSRSAWA